MKTIGSFKLHKRGVEGISISSQQLSKSIVDQNSDIVFHDEVNTFRRESVPEHILTAIDRLKYFFLESTGHWIEPYDEYLDKKSFLLLPMPESPRPGRIHLQALWQRTFVTQVRITENTFMIMGMMEVIEDKPLNLNPPKISSEDDQKYYGNAREVIKGIIGLLVQYFSTAAISDVDDYRKYLIGHADENGKTEIAKFDDTQIINTIMDKLANNGTIIMMEGESSNALVEHEPVAYEAEAVDPVEETEDVAVDPVAEAVEEITAEPEPEMDAGEDWTPQVEKAKDPFGKPAAEEGKAEVVTPDMEYSKGGDDLADLPDEDFE